MQRRNRTLLYSPSDLIRFLESTFASWMDRYHFEFPGELTPDEDSASMRFVAEEGTRHEAAFLTELISEGRQVVEIAREGAEAATLDALRRGVEVLFQGCVSDGVFFGYADFIVRDPEGNLEIWDTKLARKVKPYYLIQLCCYAEILEQITGKRPERLRVILGNGERVAFVTSEYFPYYARLKKQFLEFMDEFDPEASPVPVARQDHGRWQSHAEQKLVEIDHLSLVAGIRGSQIARLESVGVKTLTDLAGWSGQDVNGIPSKVLEEIVAQARLQLKTRQRRAEDGDEAHAACEVIRPSGDLRRGLQLLPSADPNDVYFDFEGFPFSEDGLEYLIGAVVHEGEAFGFIDWWAHDREQERLLLVGFIEWAHARWRANPNLHLYHYASYEVSALKKLAGRYGEVEGLLDDLLRGEVFIDLYKVVRQGVRIGEDSYSIKSVEKLYRGARGGDVTTAGDSIAEYGSWIERGESQDWRKSPVLKGIRDYNEDDCVSTAELVTWLRRIQVDSGVSYVPPPTFEEQEAKKPVGRTRTPSPDFINGGQSSEIAAKLVNASGPGVGREQREIARGLLEYHRREIRPAWWEFFSRLGGTVDELEADLECLGGVTRTDQPPVADKRSWLIDFAFNAEQNTKIAEESDVVFPENSWISCKVGELDETRGEVRLRISEKRLQEGFGGRLPGFSSLVPFPFANNRVLEQSLRRSFCDWVEGRGLPSGVAALLGRRVPGSGTENLLRDGEEPVKGVARIARGMKNSVLCVQGPPGTGKTFTAARMIVDLVGQGRSVGLCSNGRRAIVNLLKAVDDQTEAAIRLVYAERKPDPTLQFRLLNLTQCGSEKAHDQYQSGLVAGTAWLFARSEWVGALDFLVMDEASQVPLANAVAVAPSASNLVLLGDQMQLPQPMKGKHPNGSGNSVLGFFLKDQATVDPRKGVFLPESRRMVPPLCKVVSDLVYEGRLRSHPGVVEWNLRPAADSRLLTRHTGILFSGVEHDGNRQFSLEEVARVRDLTRELLKSRVTLNGATRRLAISDILYVSPYNLQVRKLKAALPDGARVGSVDRFQGQEAEIVIYSMGASAGEYGNRGLGFLLDINRMNVALSRARQLAIVVSDPRIIQSPVRSVADMRRLAFLARVMESE